MSTNKHPKAGPKGKDDLGADIPPLQDDLTRNPGIGASKGSFAATGEDPESIEATNTSEGDVMNDATSGGGVKPGQQGRTNK